MSTLSYLVSASWRWRSSCCSSCRSWAGPSRASRPTRSTKHPSLASKFEPLEPGSCRCPPLQTAFLLLCLTQCLQTTAAAKRAVLQSKGKRRRLEAREGAFERCSKGSEVGEVPKLLTLVAPVDRSDVGPDAYCTTQPHNGNFNTITQLLYQHQSPAPSAV